MECSFCANSEIGDIKGIENDILVKVKKFKLFDIDLETTKICDSCQNHFQALIQMDEYIKNKQKSQEEMGSEMYEQLKKNAGFEKVIKQMVAEELKMKQQKKSAIVKKPVPSSNRPSTSKGQHKSKQWFSSGEWIEIFNTAIKKYECGQIRHAIGNGYFLVEIKKEVVKRNQRYFKKIN